MEKLKLFSMKKLRFWLILITVLHIIFALSVSGKGQGESENDAGHQERQGQGERSDEGDGAGDDEFKSFIDKPNNKKTTTIKVKFEEEGRERQDEAGEVKEEEVAKKECESNFYYGVGISFGFENTIISVGKGYAADKAGVMVGDKILGYIDHSNGVFREGTNFRGAEGEGIDIFVIRDGKKLKFTMVREKICYTT